MPNLKIYNFTLTIQHDDGIRTVKTTASCEKFAIIKVAKAENCPETAIKNVEKGSEVASFVIK